MKLTDMNGYNSVDKIERDRLRALSDKCHVVFEEEPVMHGRIKMTENEAKAIKWMKCVKDDAVVTLDHIVKNEPNVSPMLYAGRKEMAETIINGFEELEKYRAIGTVVECQETAERQKAKPVCAREIGIHRECMTKEYFCPECGAPLNIRDRSKNFKTVKCIFCFTCGQKLKWDGI